VFSIDPTDASVDWLDNDHVICVYCGSISVPRLHKEESKRVESSYELRVIVAAEER
jgi:hypothetical protein